MGKGIILTDMVIKCIAFDDCLMDLLVFTARAMLALQALY